MLQQEVAFCHLSVDGDAVHLRCVMVLGIQRLLLLVGTQTAQRGLCLVSLQVAYGWLLICCLGLSFTAKYT